MHEDVSIEPPLLRMPFAAQAMRVATVAIVACVMAVGAPVRAQLPREPSDSVHAPRLRTFEHRVQPVTVDSVQHYGSPLQMLEGRGAADVREVALQRGLAWTLRLLDSDYALRFMAGDALEMLHELTVPASESVLARAASEAIRITAARIAAEPAEYFTPNTQGRWQFIAIIRLMHMHRVDVSPFLTFYEEHFPGPPGPYEDHFYDITFTEAVRTAHHASMGNYLTYASFLHFLLRDYPSTPFDLPDDEFPSFLSRLSELTYQTDEAVATGDSTKQGNGQSDPLAEQDYFATHLAMMLTNWGEEPLLRNGVTRQLIPPLTEYIDERYDRVRTGSEDFVLFAEFVEALRLLEARRDDRVELGEKELLRRQHADGSWGAETTATITENPYAAMHPTWAAMAALRHGR